MADQGFERKQQPATEEPAPRVARRTAGPSGLLALQRGAGNQAVQRLLAQRFPVKVEARTAAHTIRGGMSMTALVGGESEWAYGSGPPGGVPNLMKKVGAHLQGKHRYIAGHLLNDNMGGRGTNDNLTVLSSNANKRHTGIEGKVKTLAKQADLINRGSKIFGDPAHDHGVRYRVEVLAPAPGANPPYSPQEKHIGSGLEIDVEPIRIHKVTGVESTWPEAAAAKLKDHVVPNVPPYPPVAAKKKLTPMQRHIAKAIVAFGATGASFKEITKYLAANVNPIPTRPGVALALKRGVSTKFFSSRAGVYKVIAKNVL